MTPTMLNLFFVQEMLKPVNPLAWKQFLSNQRNARHRKKDPEKKRAEGRAYYARNADEISVKKRAARAAAPKEARVVRTVEEIKRDRSIYNRAWRRGNPNRLLEYARRQKTSPKNNAVRREYCKRRKSEDPGFKLRGNLCNRLRHALKGNIKVGHTRELVGMPIEELLIYLQGQFRPGMAWENYGSVWSVDHIRPCSSFDLSDPAQQKECFFWENLQPLFIEENSRKGNRYVPR